MQVYRISTTLLGCCALLWLAGAGVAVAQKPTQNRKPDKANKGEKLETRAPKADRYKGENSRPTLTRAQLVERDSKYYEASTRMVQQQPEEAINLFRQVLMIDPEHAASNHFLSKLYAEQGKYELALPYAEKALKNDPANFWFYQPLAQLYLKNRQTDKAVNVLQEGAKRFPRQIELLAELADLYMATNQKQKALSTYDTLIARTGDRPQYTLKKAQVLMNLKDTEGAIRLLRQLWADYPQDHDYPELIYEIYLQADKKKEAEDFLREILAKDPSNSFALVKLLQLRGVDSFLASYIEKVAESPDVELSTKIRVVAALVQVSNKDELNKAADKVTRALVSQHSGQSQALALRGDYFAIRSNLDSARKYYKRATQLDESNQLYWDLLIQLDNQLQNKDSTLADIRQAIEIFPNHSNFLYIHGLTAYEAKLYGEAGRSIERLLKQGELNSALEVQLLGLLGDIRYHEQKYAESDSYFERALKINPNDFTVLNNYAYFLSLRKQRLDTALIMIRKVVEHQPNESAYADTYGWVLFQMGQYKEALKWVQRAYEAGASPEISEHLGDVYFRLNQPEEARRYWQKARDLGQKGEELDQKLKTGRIP